MNTEKIPKEECGREGQYYQCKTIISEYIDESLNKRDKQINDKFDSLLETIKKELRRLIDYIKGDGYTMQNTLVGKIDDMSHRVDDLEKFKKTIYKIFWIVFGIVSTGVVSFVGSMIWWFIKHS